MAKNEAKIKFTAETGEFDDSIKKSNEEMAKLRAELNLNEQQMKNTGTSVEGLEKKQKLLEEQLKSSKDKTEALSQKVEKAKEIFGDNSTEVKKLEVQLINAQTAEKKLEGQVSSCKDELEKQKRESEDSNKSFKKLNDTIDDQRAEVDKLKDEYVEAVIQYGETSDEAKNLASKIDSLSGELKDNKTKMQDAKDAADKLDQSLEDVSDNDGEGFTVFKGALANLVSDGIQSAKDAIGELVGYMMGLPEETREIRQNFATLTTAFTNVGFSTETATDTWKELYAVLGDDGTAVEAANHIARLSDNQKDLNDWVTISTGLYATYQDAISPAAIAESANETALCGTVTGQLADALNWSSEAAQMFAGYMNDEVVTAEDAFNEALANCNSEQERQQLITDTLTTLYGGAADTYRDASGAMIEAKEATAETIIAENNLGEALEPLTTEWTNVKNQMKEAFLPVAEKVSEWGVGALGWLKEHPVLMKTLGAVLGVVAVALGTLATIVTVYTIAQWAMNAAILANPLTWIIVGIVAAIAAIVAIIVVVIEYWDQIVAAVTKACNAVVDAIKSAWDWICNLFSTIGTWIYDNVIAPVANFFVGLWDGIKNGAVAMWTGICTFFSTIGTWIYDNVIAPVANFFTGLWEGIVNTFHMVIDPWIEIIKRAAQWVYDTVILPVADFFVGLWDGITSGLQAAWDWCVGIALTIASWVDNNVIQPVKNLFISLWEGIKNVFSAAGNWFNTSVIQPVVGFFKGMWEGLKNGAKSAWEGIKSVFSNVANFFGDVFSKAWQKVKDIFSVGGKIFDGIKDGIVKGFKVVVNAIIKGINKVVELPFKGLNAAIKGLKKIEILGVKPFDWMDTIGIPQIPLLAKGGILTKPTLNIAGEAGPEAIIPIDKLEGYISNAVEKSMSAVNIQSLAAAIEDLANRPIKLFINDRELATATASAADDVNGMRNILHSRGLLVD